MTEPTAEQIDAERAQVIAIVLGLQNKFGWSSNEAQKVDDVMSTALARVRIEAHAAGRDDGLREAVDVADKNCQHGDCKCKRGVRDDIRALRGRT